MKTRKMLSLLLAILFTLSVFSACSSGKEGVSESGSSTEESSEQSSSSESSAEEVSEEGDAAADDIMTPYGKYPERVTIHLAKESDPSANLLSGDTQENNVLTRWITDKINVDFVVDWEVDNSEYANKLSLMLASGDLPDMITLGSGQFLLFKQLQSNNLLADVQEVFDACANDYFKSVVEATDPNYVNFFRNENGELNALVGGISSGNQPLAWIRTDWMKEAGIEEVPTDIAGIEELLTIWRDNPPVDNYVGMPLIHSKCVNVTSTRSAAPILAAFGAYPGIWIKDENGDVIWGSTAPQVKEGLAVLADWYAKGLIDKQFATRTDPNMYYSLIADGQVGFAFVEWALHYTAGADFAKRNPEAKDALLPFNVPLDANGKYNVVEGSYSPFFVCINREFEHPEAVVKVLNLESDMWDEFDEEAKELIAPAKANNASPMALKPSGRFGLTSLTALQDNSEYIMSYIEGEGKTDLQPVSPGITSIAEMALQYSKNGSASDNDFMNYVSYYAYAEGGATTGLPEVSTHKTAFYFTTETMADLKPNLDTLEDTTFLKIIMGELPVDAFDQFVEDWYAQGGQTMTDEVRALVNG